MNAVTGRSDHTNGVVLVLLAGTCWSIGGLVVRLIGDATPWHIVFYRSLTLALTLAVVLLLRHGSALLQAVQAAGVMAVVAGLCLAVAFASWIFALMHTTVANALFLLTTQPFLTALLARVLLGERVHRTTWLTMSLALVGVGVMVRESLTLGTFFGNLIALGAALGISGFTIALRKGKELDMFPATWWAGSFASLLAAGMLLTHGQPLTVGLWDLGLCSILGVVQIGCGLMAYTVGSRYLPAAELALLSLTEVILGPIWVWLGVGEVPSQWTLVGGMIMLLAVVWQVRFQPS
jgi:drug/metabolite transporter (DMT)-like permease